MTVRQTLWLFALWMLSSIYFSTCVLNTLSLQWYPHSKTKSLMKSSIDRLLCSEMDMCYVHDTVKLPQFSPYFFDFSCSKTCQSCPALNIIRFLTAFLALSESPDQWRRDAATERGIPASLHHCWMPFHWACDPRVKKCEKVQYILQKTPVWKNWWLFCAVSLCMEKHPPVKFTLVRNHVLFLANTLEQLFV